MTEIVTDSTEQSTSHSLPPTTPTGGPSPTKLHAMSTRSSEALARQQSIHPQQQPLTPRSGLPTATGLQQDLPPHGGLSSIEGRLTRKRARSINVEEANRPRGDRALQSPALGGAPSSAASSVSNSDRICLCPAEPKVKRPRNGTCDSLCYVLGLLFEHAHCSCCFPFCGTGVSVSSRLCLRRNSDSHSLFV